MKELAEVIKLQLDNGGKATLTVTGNSMLPMLVSRRDSVVLVLPGNQKKGDVVLFASVGAGMNINAFVYQV